MTAEHCKTLHTPPQSSASPVVTAAIKLACLTLVNMPCPISMPAVVTMTEPSAMMLTMAGRGCTMLLNLQSRHKSTSGTVQRQGIHQKLTQRQSHLSCQWTQHATATICTIQKLPRSLLLQTHSQTKANIPAVGHADAALEPLVLAVEVCNLVLALQEVRVLLHLQEAYGIPQTLSCLLRPQPHEHAQYMQLSLHSVSGSSLS